MKGQKELMEGEIGSIIHNYRPETALLFRLHEVVNEIAAKTARRQTTPFIAGKATAEAMIWGIYCNSKGRPYNAHKLIPGQK